MEGMRLRLRRLHDVLLLHQLERISQPPHEDGDAPASDEAAEVLGFVLVTGDEAVEAEQPSERPLYLPASCGDAWVMWGDHLHSLLSELLVESIGTPRSTTELVRHRPGGRLIAASYFLSKACGWAA